LTGQKGKKVLIIEDEAIIRTMCQRILNGDGIDVDVVNDGKEAEKAVARRNYDLLLVDIRLPGESGVEFYKWLVQEYPEMALKAIFMTGNIMDTETMSELKAIDRPYLLKPFRPAELKKIVTEALGQS